MLTAEVAIEQDLGYVAKLIKESDLFEGLEDLNKFLGKQMLFLTLLEIKPVCVIDARRWVETDSGKISIPEDRNKVSDFLNKLKLLYEIEEDEHSLYIIASKSPELITEFQYASGRRAKNQEEERQFDLIRGTLLGYPQTAVDAYVKGDVLGLEEQQERLKEAGFSQKLIEFVNMRLSKTQYLEEAKEVQGWLDLLTKFNLT